MMLEHVTEPVGEGPAVTLSGSYYRTALKLMIHRDGRLRDVLLEPMAVLPFLDARQQLVTLGNVVIDLFRAGRPGRKLLKSTLKEAATFVVMSRSTADKWDSQDWFKKVFFHKSNQGENAAPVTRFEDIKEGGAAAAYMSAARRPMNAAVRLAWYMRLLCNTLALEVAAKGVAPEIRDMLVMSPLTTPDGGTQHQLFVRLRQCENQFKDQPEVPEVPAAPATGPPAVAPPPAPAPLRPNRPRSGKDGTRRR
eukprot:GHUV01036533.1.p2 GENE.GHUV01036533.1~~GHUV01036533.1.p2  ORF type:complete len:251 (+),score=54.83 GHUV01036533.1:1901-2653(+)